MLKIPRPADRLVFLFVVLCVQASFASAACTEGADGCQRCDGSSCLLCNEGFFLSAGRCSVCAVGHCRVCRTGSTCSACADGFYWYSSSKCLPCFTGCQTCYAGTAASCTSCLDGYSFSPTRGCPACPSNCQTCYSRVSFAQTTVYCATCFEGTPLADGTCPTRYASLNEKN